MKHDLDIATENPEATISRLPALPFTRLASPCVLVAQPLTRWGACKERLAALLYRLADWLSEDL
jgi:hypothetical protein